MLEAVAAHAREALPGECCGVLVGSDNEIRESVRIANVAAEPHRYFLDPAEHIAARRAARQRGLEVLGFYHSHPDSEPEPSARDLAEAAYPDHLYLIVRPERTSAKVRLFRFEGSSFREIGFVRF